MISNRRCVVGAALFLGCLLVPSSLRAEDDPLGAAFTTLREPVAAGRMHSVLKALDDLEAELEQARVTTLGRVLPAAAAGWRIVEDSWACREGLRGSRTYETAGEKTQELRLTEHDPGKEILQVVERLLDPQQVDKERERVETVGGRRALVTFRSWEGGSRGVVHWVLPKPDRTRMHGGLSLLTLETGNLSRHDLLAAASRVDVAAIQARLEDQPAGKEARDAAVGHLLAQAAMAYDKDRLGQALGWTRRLKKRVASERARHIQAALPREPTGWRYASGGLGGWPAGASKSFRHERGMSVHVGVSEGRADEIRAVAARLRDPSTLKPGESVAQIGGRRALLAHDAKQSMFLLRVPVADGSALAWVRSWDAPDRAPVDLFSGLLDLATVEEALRR